VAVDLAETRVARSRVRDWMVSDVPVLTPQTSIGAALRLLREHHLPALPVWAKGRLAGMVDEKALLRFTPSEATTLDVYELHEVLDRMTVARVAIPASHTVDPAQLMRDAAAVVRKTGADVVPVVEDGRFVGLLTWCGVLGSMLEDHEEA
jgi:acetoin utilization protein AcuB